MNNIFTEERWLVSRTLSILFFQCLIHSFLDLVFELSQQQIYPHNIMHINIY